MLYISVQRHGTDLPIYGYRPYRRRSDPEGIGWCLKITPKTSTALRPLRKFSGWSKPWPGLPGLWWGKGFEVVFSRWIL